MIEDHFKSPEEVEMLQIWLDSPPKSREPLPPHLEDKLERCKRAYRLLDEHMSEPVVVDTIHAYYTDLGRKYSIATARLDVKDAQRLFLDLDTYRGPSIVGLMLNRLQERFMAACRAKDDKMVDKLANTIIKTLDRWEKYVENHKGAAIPPPPIIAITNAKLLGIEEDPHIIEKLTAVRDRLLGPYTSASRPVDADFTELSEDDATT